MATTAVVPNASTPAVWTRESIQALLEKNDFAVERALLTLFERQTESEQTVEATTQKNGVGFTGFDGEIFSSFAKQILKSRRPNGERLSPKQLAVCRRHGKNGVSRIGRYAGQLLEAIAAKGGAVDLKKRPAPQVRENADIAA